MRIAQVAPLFEAVPPKLYGGTERVVAYLTEELVRLGHEVTLFASADSETSARLVPICRRAIRLDPDCRHPLAYQVLQIETVVQQAALFDVVHVHEDCLHLPALRRTRCPHVTTMHGRLDLPELALLFREYRDAPLVSISNAQRRPLAWANWQATVHHGLPLDLYRMQAGAGRYLAFIGRICPEKGVDRAIEIARRAGMPLKIAAKIDAADRDYFEAEIRHLFEQPGVEYVGEVGERDKQAFLGGASALLFPIDWPEPFGLVVIEALACGTPVIAFPCGSVPELLEDGATGFLVAGLEEAVAAVGRIAELDRARCRRAFEERFSANRMARDYLGVYAGLVAGRSEAREPAGLLVPLRGATGAGTRHPVLSAAPVAANQKDKIA